MDYQTSFAIILHAGNAKTCIAEAVEAAETGEFPLATEKLEAAQEEMLQAHAQHQSLLTQLAKGEEIPVDLMMVHAEDHLSAASEELLLVKHLITLYQRLEEK